MSYLKQQDTNQNTGRYRIDKFSVILSEVQTGNSNQYKTWKYNYQRARR